MSQVELVREQWIFDHVAPDVRSITLEYTVRNTGPDELFQLFLPLNAFLANLQVLDEDGRHLNYLPNREVERALQEVRKEKPGAYDRAMTAAPHPQYRISIVLPPDAPLRPGAMRTLRLVHTDGEKPRYLALRALTLPSYHISHVRRVGQPYGIHVAVNAPPDTQLAVDLDDKTVRSREHYHATPPADIDYHFNAYLPPPGDEPYVWRANYHMGPAFMEELVLTGWLLLAAVLGIGVLLAALSSSASAQTAREMLAISGGVSATSAGLLLALRNAWASRYLKLLIPVFAISAIAWLLWFVHGG
ncbi:MAG TPA: hypothetical protein VEY12_04485 [Thermoplasmata archaeon]|nr:hypothetical protein [Thermoplasmata archaeon]